MAGRLKRSWASTSELAACNSLSAVRLMCARVELLCREYTAPHDTCIYVSSANSSNFIVRKTLLAAPIAVGALVLCAFVRQGLGQVAGSRRSVEGVSRVWQGHLKGGSKKVHVSSLPSSAKGRVHDDRVRQQSALLSKRPNIAPHKVNL